MSRSDSGLGLACVVTWETRCRCGGIGCWSGFVPSGMDNEASVPTMGIERWDSVSLIKSTGYQSDLYKARQ